MGIGNGRHRSVDHGKAGETGRREHGTLDMNVGIHKTGKDIGIIPVALPVNAGYDAVGDMDCSRKNGLVMEIDDITGDGLHSKTRITE